MQTVPMVVKDAIGQRECLPSSGLDSKALLFLGPAEISLVLLWCSLIGYKICVYFFAVHARGVQSPENVFLLCVRFNCATHAHHSRLLRWA